MKKWLPLIVLGAAQFLMILDTTVMNVSISQLVEDFNTDITQIQVAIALYALVMAAFMITGGKLGDVWGRRKIFGIGLFIYGIGSAITAISWSVPTLIFGWSLLEGIGAALVLPAMVALIAENYRGRDRALAYGIIGGIAGAAVAVGPIIGGWMTTNLTWRLVFVGEVFIVIGIILSIKKIAHVRTSDKQLAIDWFGAFLNGLGLAFIVLGVLKSSQWGLIKPFNSPIEPLGFALTPFVIGLGLAIIYGFVSWQRRRERLHKPTLIKLDLFNNAPFRSGLMMIFSQNLILAGIFFGIPLYLQLVIGLDAFNTGVRMLPVSITLLAASAIGARLILRFSPRFIVRIALIVLLLSIGVLLASIEATLDGFGFGFSMALLGIGIGLMAAVLGNLIQFSVGESDRSEAGGLQNTSLQLGMALGTAIIGAVIVSSLALSFISQIEKDERISSSIEQTAEVELSKGVSFISTTQLSEALEQTALTEEETKALIENYSQSQLESLKLAFFVVAIIIFLALTMTHRLPTKRIDQIVQ